MKLFLDDIRIPKEVWDYTTQKIYLAKDWVIVRSHKEFAKWITKNGLPDFISFDHDLSDIQYKKNFKEETGYTSAQWLVDYCLDNNKSLPEFFVHSMNPIGKEKINSLLNNFKKFNR